MPGRVKQTTVVLAAGFLAVAGALSVAVMPAAAGRRGWRSEHGHHRRSVQLHRSGGIVDQPDLRHDAGVGVLGQQPRRARRASGPPRGPRRRLQRRQGLGKRPDCGQSGPRRRHLRQQRRGPVVRFGGQDRERAGARRAGDRIGLAELRLLPGRGDFQLHKLGRRHHRQERGSEEGSPRCTAWR